MDMKKMIQVIIETVGASEDEVTLEGELSRNYTHFTGVAFLDNIGEGNILLQSFLDQSEIFPNDFEVEFLQTNSSVAPNDRFLSIGNKKIDGTKVKFKYKDGGNAPNYPYELKVYLRLENCDNE